jgi:selenocysteine lyase/cysteine desulfurase
MHSLGRRAFVSRLAVPVALAGVVPRVEGARLRAFLPAAEDDDAAVFAEARRHFLIPEGVVYGNTGTLGASPREVVQELTRRIEQLESELADWDYYRVDGEPLTGYQPLAEFRAAVGAVVGATADEIALTQNATMGMNFVAAGLDLAAGDEVVSTDQEHPGGICPWRLAAKRRGVVVKELPLLPVLKDGPEAVVRLFADAITPRTRVLVVSHVSSGLGIRLPARELCALARERGLLAVVDGAQAVGQIPVDVKELGCDAYVASPHKWLLAPKGTGFLYLRRESQNRLWTTLASAAFEDREKGAFRFMQYGTGSVPLVHGLLAALRFVERIGIPRITRWDAELTRRLREGLARIPAARLSSPADPRFAAAITTFGVEGVPAKALQDALWSRKIRVRAQGDERGVRFSTHLYVSPKDIDTALEVVASLHA